MRNPQHRIRKLAVLALFCFIAQTSAAEPDVTRVREQAVRAARLVFGQQRADVQLPNMLLFEALQLSLSNPDGVDEMGKETMIIGCRYQNCSEKGAAMLDRASQRLLGMALIHRRCHFLSGNYAQDGAKEDKRDGIVQCENAERLDIYLTRSAAHPDLARETRVRNELSSWGKFRDVPDANIILWSTP